MRLALALRLAGAMPVLAWWLYLRWSAPLANPALLWVVLGGAAWLCCLLEARLAHALRPVPRLA